MTAFVLPVSCSHCGGDVQLLASKSNAGKVNPKKKDDGPQPGTHATAVVECVGDCGRNWLIDVVLRPFAKVGDKTATDRARRARAS